MTKRELNKIISDFMGYEDKHQEEYDLIVMPYVNNISTLIPVWKKLNVRSANLLLNNGDKCKYFLCTDPFDRDWETGIRVDMLFT